MLAGATPDLRIFVLAALYSFGAHGIMTVNDFKSTLPYGGQDEDGCSSYGF